MLKKISSFSLILFIVFEHATASTIGIATGNKTVDGRPIMFKTKDRADNYPSDVDYYPGTSYFYAYTFQVNDGDSHDEARMGINSVGFGVVYTSSENLNGAGTGPSGSEFAAIALKTCETIQSFRELLAATAGNRDVNEHYGIIDSSGQGSLFEVDGWSHVEIPVIDSIGAMANTAKYHPSAGAPASGSTSPEREARVIYLLEHGPDEGLGYRYFVNEVMKDFCTTQSDEDQMPVGQYKTNAVISRYKTAAACVIKGCKSGDDPQLESVMWLSLGEPSFSVALPFLSNTPQMYGSIRTNTPGDGMAGSIDRMRTLIYDYSGGRYDDRYADTNMLVNIRAKTFPVQDSLSTLYDTALSEWREMETESRQSSMQEWVLEAQEYGKTSFDSIYQKITVIESTGRQEKVPVSIRLYQNYPNPFNNETRFEIDIANFSQTRIQLEIFNQRGKRVRILSPVNTNTQRLTFQWDGKNTAGNELSSGVYYYRIAQASTVPSKKLILLK